MSGSITVAGWVGKTPTLIVSASGRKYATVRVASTHRYRNAQQEWVDSDTQWFSVRLWDESAENVTASVHVGEPVIVTGRPVLERWEAEDGPRAVLGIRNATIGHDLSKGRSAFTRVQHERAAAGEAATPGAFVASDPSGDDPFAITSSAEPDDASGQDADASGQDAEATAGSGVGTDSEVEDTSGEVGEFDSSEEMEGGLARALGTFEAAGA